MSDKIDIHIDPIDVQPGILDHQVEACPTCKGSLMTSFGLAGGGMGPYGYCDTCQRVVWKCAMSDDES